MDDDAGNVIDGIVRQVPYLTVALLLLPLRGMNALRPILLALTAAAALSFAYPAKANLITNPGFETGDFTGWTVGGAPFVTGTFGGIAPHSGNFQATSGLLSMALGQTLATTPGQSYTIDFWAAANIGGFGFFINWGGSNVFGHTFPASTGYTEFTFNVSASSASTTMQFVSPNGNIFLDDVSVNPAVVGVPDGGSTVSLLGCALLGLAALRRKLSC